MKKQVLLLTVCLLASGSAFAVKGRPGRFVRPGRPGIVRRGPERRMDSIARAAKVGGWRSTNWRGKEMNMKREWKTEMTRVHDLWRDQVKFVADAARELNREKDTDPKTIKAKRRAYNRAVGKMGQLSRRLKNVKVREPRERAS